VLNQYKFLLVCATDLKKTLFHSKIKSYYIINLDLTHLKLLN